MSARTHISNYAYDDACKSQYAYDEAHYVHKQTSMHTINHTLNPLILVRVSLGLFFVLMISYVFTNVFVFSHILFYFQ